MSGGKEAGIAVGVASGAATGAAAGPVGAVIGGVVGGVSAYLSSADEARVPMPQRGGKGILILQEVLAGQRLPPDPEFFRKNWEYLGLASKPSKAEAKQMFRDSKDLFKRAIAQNAAMDGGLTPIEAVVGGVVQEPGDPVGLPTDQLSAAVVPSTGQLSAAIVPSPGRGNRRVTTAAPSTPASAPASTSGLSPAMLGLIGVGLFLMGRK